MSLTKRYLFYFAQDLLEFRRPEFESILRIFNINEIEVKRDELKPYWLVSNLNEQQAVNIASRSVLLRFVVEIWASGVSYEDFHSNLRNFQVEEKYKTESFKFKVETYNRRLKQREKITKIESMSYLPLDGDIKLIDPTHKFIYFEYYGLDTVNIPEVPEEIFMGKLISKGSRDLINSISLKTRKFIGNTSMSPELSILMANQGLCDKNHLVYDCFCGTGSMLIAAGLFGSYVLGSDIDFLMLHARTKPSRISQKIRAKDESVKANMEQYNLSKYYLDVFVGDFATCPLVDSLKFDSIICDPPYGIREAMSKIERKEATKSTALGEDAVHFPSLSTYTFKHLFEDLLKYAAKHLTMNGRLVCWFPCLKPSYDDKMIPQHSALKLMSNSEQRLQGLTARRLLTYEKISEEGELIENSLLDGLNFRDQYFCLLDEKKVEKTKEKTEALRKRNNEESAKRGIRIPSLYEYKQNANKKKLKE